MVVAKSGRRPSRPKARAAQRPPAVKSAPPVTLAFHKPYGVLSRFSPDGSAWRTLAEFGLPRDVWPVGRLDADSEGLLILSSDKRLVDRLLAPERAHAKTYWVQVERVPDAAALAQLEAGVVLDGARTRPARAQLIDAPPLPPREPPIRVRKTVPDAWIALAITEGRNRQVRRMTAAVGHPTLRLVRVAIGGYALGALAPGQACTLDAAAIDALLAKPTGAALLVPSPSLSSPSRPPDGVPR